MALNIPQPEQYTLPSTAHVPNSPMPVLVYRNVLPMPRTMEVTQEFIESHGWSRQGIVWPAIYTRHFHPNVHECYAILSGHSEVLMGVGKLDNANGHKPEDHDSEEIGLFLTLREGDVIVHPAGTGHAKISDERDYRYLSFFPSGSPRWVSCNGDTELDRDDPLAETMAVPTPPDPVLGNYGHLNALWSGPRRAYFSKAGSKAGKCS
ncbi:hypothetical protein ASPVEDRAFT_49477 [Aspergillus versicolor CBS 583.65]|uniref:Cupin type-1 domain-containing protein n=1 Tax=Aspergillus versicolor CBS 583.65 TaxID=1036611 RepID=A0A1L9P7G4_ASPVE|nr:uncharacterized protein ASPVEDRAFT_49477 [Aspergillus versicolor CBS 583.65]OJI97479.1 hypothetical protein ASPVEDRAFT_49477 [Aspergillus versicolor CBS 583.65]